MTRMVAPFCESPLTWAHGPFIIILSWRTWSNPIAWIKYVILLTPNNNIIIIHLVLRLLEDLRFYSIVKIPISNKKDMVMESIAYNLSTANSLLFFKNRPYQEHHDDMTLVAASPLENWMATPAPSSPFYSSLY